MQAVRDLGKGALQSHRCTRTLVGNSQQAGKFMFIVLNSTLISTMCGKVSEPSLQQIIQLGDGVVWLSHMSAHGRGSGWIRKLAKRPVKQYAIGTGRV